MARLVTIVLAAVVFAASFVTIGAQSTGAPVALPAVAFEAASVRPNKSGEVGGFVRRQPGGRFNAQNMPLRALITFAYQLQGNQLRGGPDWLATERFDIVAKAEGDPPPVPPGSGPDQLMLMLRSLLADRFKLQVHWETQDLPIYALVLARDDKRLGPQLKPASTDCNALLAAARQGGAAPAPPSPDAPIQCGIRMSPGRIQFGGSPLSQFANALSSQTGRIVHDRTGLTGTWEFELKFTPEQLPQQVAGADAPAPDPNGASLFTAIQEQLGLRLESTRAPTEVLLIDSVQMPTPD
jgi:uncharacterized protein (TIGR03435 family)